MDNKFTNIPKEKFQFVQEGAKLHDKKFETKPIGFFKDALNRFSKNKSAVVAAWIVLFLVVFAIVGPYLFDADYQAAYELDIDLKRYEKLPPKISFLDGTGVWDGSQVKEITEAQYLKYIARGQETGYNPIQEIIDEYTVTDTSGTKKMYTIRLDQYHNIPTFPKIYTLTEYQAIQQWQNETGIQVILPWVDRYERNNEVDYIKNSPVRSSDINVWYASDDKGNPKFDHDGNLIPGYRTANVGFDDKYDSIRLAGDPGNTDPTSEQRWKYAKANLSAATDTSLPESEWIFNYEVRINAYNYFVYKYGFEPSFVFGSTEKGYDLLTRLASGARFSLLLALAVSAINLFIGAIYGAIEGYYGGTADLIMERISDILASVPSMVVTVLFNLHLAKHVGIVVALLFAFVMTGWIGMASRTRMQFYRFKNQEYVLAARTLGARDARIMFKHIFPNSLGTIITGSILSIPGVIFSETSLTYLGIINLDSPTRASVGAMLSAGQGDLSTFPHLVLFPSLFIGLLMVSFNLFGNGLRDAFNPSLRGSED